MSEAFYDQHIAPELLRLARVAEANGVSLVAMAEWEPGQRGLTATLQASASFAVRMAEVAMRSKGNVDTFMLAMERYAREHGHSSIYLRAAGIPST